MIARVWKGRTIEKDADRYARYLEETGVKDCLSTEGNRGVFVGRRIESGTAEFLFISYWESMEVIKDFSGEDVERAVYYPEDEKFLLELDPKVTHYRWLRKSLHYTSFHLAQHG